MLHILPTYFIEAKEAIINKLNLTDEQKVEIQELVNKYPQKASKIDWNKKDLSYEELSLILKEQSKKDIKKGRISGLVAGKDYIDASDSNLFPNMQIYIPLCYNASKVLANKRIGDVEGKWCISDQNTRENWDLYVNGIPNVPLEELQEMFEMGLMDFEGIEPPEDPKEYKRQFHEWLRVSIDDVFDVYATPSQGVFLFIIIDRQIQSTKKYFTKIAAYYDIKYNPSVEFVAAWTENDSMLERDWLKENFNIGFEDKTFFNRKMYDHARSLINSHPDNQDAIKQRKRLLGY